VFPGFGDNYEYGSGEIDAGSTNINVSPDGLSLTMTGVARGSGGFVECYPYGEGGGVCTPTGNVYDFAFTNWNYIANFFSYDGGQMWWFQNLNIFSLTPVPLINQPLVPTSIAPGGNGFALVVNGTGFVSSSVVNWNGSPLPTTFVSYGQLTAVVPASDVTNVGTASVTVTSPTPGGGTSNEAFLSVTNPTPSVSMNTKLSPVTGSSPASVAVGDFNGDDKLDLAVANENSNTVSILLGDGAGNFRLASSSATGYLPISLAVGDFNGDGILDLAVANYGSNSVSILLGDSTGNFKLASSLATGGYPDSVAVGDFNGDGRLDLVVANATSDTVSVFLGDGTGNFTLTSSPSTGSRPESVAVGDFNGDGILDLAVANFGSNTVSILLGDGTGNFSLISSPGMGSFPDSVAIGDFNGDGILDLAVANYEGNEGNSVSILLGDGAGNFKLASSLATGSYPSSVALADFNGDGKLDLAVANFTSSTVSVFLGDGTGNFALALSFGAGSGPDSVAVGDFNGDGRLDMAVGDGYSDVVSLLVQATATTTTITSSSNPGVFWQSLVFTATVAGQFGGTPTGTVTFTYGSATLCNAVTLVGGVATCAYSALPIGSDTVTATYSGDSNFLGSSASLNQTVNQASTTLMLISSVNPSGLDSPVTFTATITPQYGGQASGTITFKDRATTLGSTTVSGNAASLTTSALAMGTHSVTAIYSGDSNFIGSTSNTVSQVVTKATSTTTLVSSLNPSVQGKLVTFTAVVSSLAGTPTGKIEYLNGKTVLSTIKLTSGSAKYTTSKLPPGANAITAVYEGDPNNSSSTSAPVNQIVLAVTTISLTSSPNPSAYGQSVTFKAAVTSSVGAPPNGETITFKQGAVAVLGTGTLSGGTATFFTSTLTVGTKGVTAVYSGDSNFASSTSKAVSQVIRKATSATTLTSSQNPSTHGQPVTFTATVAPQFSGTPTGTVVFKDGTKALKTVTLSGGVANFTTSTLTSGTHTITATYNDSTSFDGSNSAPLTQTVN